MTPERRDRPGDSEPSPLVHLAQHSGHGLTIAVSTGLFLLAGWWLDGRVGTRPLFTIVGALIGAAAGFYSMLQHLLFFPRERERKEREAEEARKQAEASGEEGGTGA
jgi:ATP synthase protein I